MWEISSYNGIFIAEKNKFNEDNYNIIENENYMMIPLKKEKIEKIKDLNGELEKEYRNKDIYIDEFLDNCKNHKYEIISKNNFIINNNKFFIK